MKTPAALLENPIILDDTDQSSRARQLRAFANGALFARDLAIQCRSEKNVRDEHRHYQRARFYLQNIRGLLS